MGIIGPDVFDALLSDEVWNSDNPEQTLMEKVIKGKNNMETIKVDGNFYRVLDVTRTMSISGKCDKCDLNQTNGCVFQDCIPNADIYGRPVIYKKIPTITMWLSRNENDSCMLVWYGNKPTKINGVWTGTVANKSHIFCVGVVKIGTLLGPGFHGVRKGRCKEFQFYPQNSL